MIPFPENFNTLIEQSYLSEKTVVVGALGDLEVHVAWSPAAALYFGKEGAADLKVRKIARVGKNTEKIIDAVCMISFFHVGAGSLMF
jgi:hypothetical protein